MSVYSDIYIGRLPKYKLSTRTNVDFSGTGGKKGRRDEDDPVEGLDKVSVTTSHTNREQWWTRPFRVDRDKLTRHTD